MENVSRAATQKLHVSQPALSRQIRDLEDELGVQLLERTGKSVSLTKAGRIFLDEARAVLERANEAVRNVQATAGKAETELHVGYLPLASGKLMPAVLRACQSTIPHVQVRLYDWPNEENVAGVRDGRLQLAFVLKPPRPGGLRQLRFEPLLLLQARLAVAPSHPFAQRRRIPLSEAVRERFIGLIRESYPDFELFLSGVFAGVKSKPHIVEEHDGIEGIISAIEAGTGVGVFPDVFSYHVGERLKLLPLTPEPNPVPFGIVAPKGRITPAAEQFCQCAIAALAAK